MPRITAGEKSWSVPYGTNLHTALREAGLVVDAPCGGRGSCGKCRVLINGTAALSCQTTVVEDLTVILPDEVTLQSAAHGAALPAGNVGYALAFDIGTTSLVGFLLDGNTGSVICHKSVLNPQVVFGADVVSRIRSALGGQLSQLTGCIRSAITAMAQTLCSQAGIDPSRIEVVSIVGNCCMQQLFLGILPDNLAHIPYSPVITAAEVVEAAAYLPICAEAKLLIVPAIGGFVGADTVACLIADGLYQHSEMTLLVDIGTNGEMVLGNRERMIACSTAAGPALEGVNIQLGMRATEGAIDHVWLEHCKLHYSVIGGSEAMGICGSGLVDAIAVALQLGLINKRGRIATEDRQFHISDRIYLTQADIRQVQLAKGAIHAGICLMANRLGINLEDIQSVRLAGAFGSYLNAENACRIGLLPERLADRIVSIGNAAGKGAQLLACDSELLPLAHKLAEQVEFLELATLPEFPKNFANSMLFREECL